MIKIIITLLCTSLFSIAFAHGGIGPMSAWEYIFYISYLYFQVFVQYLFSVNGALFILFSLSFAYFLPSIIRNKNNWLSKRNFLIRFLLVFSVSLSITPVLLIPFLIYFFLRRVLWNVSSTNSFIKSNHKQLISAATAFLYIVHFIYMYYGISQNKAVVYSRTIEIPIQQSEPKILQKKPVAKLKVIKKSDERCRDITKSKVNSFSIGPDDNACQHLKDIRQINRSEK